MPPNRFIARQQAQLIGHQGRISEKRVATSIGARLTPNSGAMAGAKSDSILKGKTTYRVESKSTLGKSLALQHEWLAKVNREALETSCTPALTVSFVTPEGKSLPVGDWVLIPLHHFREMTEE